MSIQRLLPVAILLLVGLLWGLVTNVVKLVGQYAIAPLGYTSWTMLGAGAILVMANLARRSHLPTDGRCLVYYLISGVIGVAIPTTNMFFVLREVPVSVMSLVLATVPMFYYFFALTASLERPDLLRFSGIGLGFAGAVMLVLSSGRIEGVADPGYVALALLTPACYAANNVFVARFRPPVADSMVLAAGMLVCGGSILFILAMATGSGYAAWSGPPVAGLLIALHALISSITFALFFVLVKLAGPVFFSQVAYLVTLFGIAIGMVIFDERPGVWIWAAMALIFAGLALVNRRREAART